MKHILAILLCIGWVQQTQAQSINLFGVDATNFPTMKGKFYAFDAAGNQQRPSASELTLTENGIPQTITNVSCPPAMILKSLSSVLVVDVSGSMSSGSGSSPNIDLAKTAARAWINGLPLGKSECAVTSFDHANYLNQDFTTDRTKLLNAINTLQPSGGTDYDVALIKPLSGGLIVTRNGKYQKVLVLLTDGLPSYEPDVNTIVAEATKQGCMIFCVTLGMPAPQSVKDIATRTGGEFYENVTTVQQATDVYNRILQATQGSSPCEISWNSDVSCETRSRNIELSWQGNKTTSSYQPLTTVLAVLKVTPQYIAFGKRNPTTQNDTTITLTGVNADFTVTSINLKSGSNDFTVVNTSFPFTIPKNTSRTVTLRYTPSDSGFKYASFEVSSDRCLSYFSLSNGVQSKKANVSTLKLIQPNGGEQFIAGSDTTISWTGISPIDTVSLQYSIDSGFTWHPITILGHDLQYRWINIPNKPSKLCKVWAKHTNGGLNAKEILTLKDHTNAVRSVDWSPDGTKVCTGSQDHTAIIWSVTDGAKIFQLVGNTNYVVSSKWSPDGTKVATASSDSTATIWSAQTGTKLHNLTDHKSAVVDINWSPDGTKVATASYDNTAIIWSAVDGTKLFTLKHINTVNAIKWSPNGLNVATASADNSAAIWSALSGVPLFILSKHYYDVYCVEWSPDGSKVITGSSDGRAIIWSAEDGNIIHILNIKKSIYSVRWSPDGEKIAVVGDGGIASVWSALTGAKLFSLIGHSDVVLDVDWSPDGLKIATASYDQTAIIWSAIEGDKLITLSHPWSVDQVRWSPDGTKVATRSGYIVKIWSIEDGYLQSDTSDAVFSIVAPSPASQDVDMKQCLVSTSKDSLITTFIQNAGTYPFRVDSIAIVGTDASQFQLVSGIPPYTIGASGTHAVEFRFKPISVGVKTAQLLVYTQTDTLRQTIRGEGVAPTLQVLNDIIDFGKVEVGNQHDSLQTTTIKNIGNAPLPITATHHAGPNDKDFTTLAGGGGFTLQPGEVKTMDLRFAATDVGRTSGRLLFDYNGAGSPATVQLLAEGIFNASDTARTTVSVNNITAQAGEKVNLQLVLKKQSGMKLAGAPTDWYARVHYNSSVLYNTQTNNACIGTTDSCVIELNGTYNPTQSELISVPCVVTLGNTDNASITIDEFRWTNNSITTEVVTENGTIHVTGVCDEGGVRLFMPSNVSTSLATRPNPAQNTLTIHYGLREPLNVTIELINTTGQVVQTFVQNQQQAKGEYTLNEDISTFGNGVYMLRLVTNNDVLTTRVDVVK
ncbi:MAG: choice-of-anchor D domain-containing protein [Bacteriodetes bacterium]|nr:choice-of-anchor D domain-containing protein [Bacteroidota bacterium]